LCHWLEEHVVNLRVARLLTFGILMALDSLAPSYAARPRPVASAPVTWLIFVDDLHIDFRDTGYLRNLLRSVARELIRDGDSFIVRSSGPSALSVALDSNRGVLDASISKATGAELSNGDCLRGDMDEEIRSRAQLAGTTAAEMLHNLPKDNRPAALLYISDGYPLLPTAASIAGVPRIAQQSTVTIFALNPHALRPTPQLVAPGVPALNSCRRDDVMLKSLRALAEPTGGFAVLDEADFADALQRIGRAMRSQGSAFAM
jgi:hypothetical protein